MTGSEHAPTADAPDKELAAMQMIIAALAELDAPAKERVLDYVFRRLGLTRTSTPPSAPFPLPAGGTIPAPASHQALVQPPAPGGSTDIRTFASSKRPATDIERVAVVAYYLTEIAKGADTKAVITSDDITRFFKQAGFPLPARPRQTLHNAKNAGYVDAAAETGAFKLNPVGHNLVVHGLPSAEAPARKTKPKKKGKKKSTSR